LVNREKILVYQALDVIRGFLGPREWFSLEFLTGKIGFSGEEISFYAIVKSFLSPFLESVL